MRHCALIVALFSSLFFLSGIALAQQNAMHLFVDGVEAYESGSHQEAIDSLNKAIELEPQNLEFHYYLGLTYSAMGKHEAALEVFEKIVEKEPVNFRKAYFEIAAVYAKQKHYQKAIDTLTLVEGIEPKDARIYLEKGYAFQKLRQYDLAIESFYKAKDLEPTLLQLAFYNIGAVHLEAEAFDKAEEMFTKSIEVDPSTSLARHARQAILSVRGAKKARRPFYLSGALTWSYDDNVLQKPLEQAQIISSTGQALDEADQFQTLHVRGGYKFLNRKNLEMGAGLSCLSVAYQDLIDNNILGIIPHLYLNAGYHPFYARLQYDYSYYNAGGEGKLRMSSITPVITIVEPYNLKSEITLNHQDKNYLDEVTSDAGQVSIGIVQHYAVPNRGLYPRAGFKYGSENADEEIFSYTYYQLLLGLTSSLPWWGTRGDVSLTYEKTGFEMNPFYSAVGEREDKKYILSLSIAKPLSDIFQLAFSYSHTRNDSNVSSSGIDPYEFKKNVYGLMIMALF
jgi:tetratricopeptide (TPR) repeat protein